MQKYITIPNISVFFEVCHIRNILVQYNNSFFYRVYDKNGNRTSKAVQNKLNFVQ